MTLDGCSNKCPARLLSADWDWTLSPPHHRQCSGGVADRYGGYSQPWTADTGHQENGKWDKRVIIMKDPRIVGTWGPE